jgi:hypothetical protein
MVIGLILLVLGVVIPNSNARNDSRKNSYDKTVESRENVKGEDGRNQHKIVRERTEHHNSRRNDD